MKTKLFLLTLLCLSWFTFEISGEQARKQNLLFTKFQRLVYQHDSFLRSQDKLFDQMARGFFSDFNFIDFGKTKRFFTSLNRGKNSGAYANITMSHMQVSIINGKRHSVHYTYQSDGNNVRVIKYINNNGKILKADYTYDLKKNSLETKEYKNNQLLHQKLYNI